MDESSLDLHLLYLDPLPTCVRGFIGRVRKSCDATGTADTKTALQALGGMGPFDAVIARYGLSADGVLGFLAAARRRCARSIRVVLATDPRDPALIAAAAAGDVDLILGDPCNPEELLWAVRLATTSQRAVDKAVRRAA